MVFIRWGLSNCHGIVDVQLVSQRERDVYDGVESSTTDPGPCREVILSAAVFSVKNKVKLEK